MKLEIPPHLDSTRHLLETSLRLRRSEPVPGVPAGLLDDLNRRFAPRTRVFEPSPRATWFARLRSVASTPAFGLAAAALMVFGCVAPLVDRGSDSDADRFRGTAGSLAAPARVVLIDGPAAIEDALAQSGRFEPGSLMTVRDLAAAAEIPAPKVVLDFESATVRGFDRDGRAVHTGDLPSSIADLSLAVADALSRL